MGTFVPGVGLSLGYVCPWGAFVPGVGLSLVYVCLGVCLSLGWVCPLGRFVSGVRLSRGGFVPGVGLSLGWVCPWCTFVLGWVCLGWVCPVYVRPVYVCRCTLRQGRAVQPVHEQVKKQHGQRLQVYNTHRKDGKIVLFENYGYFDRFNIIYVNQWKSSPISNSY